MQNTENYFFIHNIFAHFFDDTLDYFADYLYPRFHHRVVGTYDKAVEYINKKIEYGNEHDMPNLPAIILNPSGEFKIADAIASGQHLWRFPNLSDGMPHLKMKLYDPIYRDNNVSIHPIFVRLKGEFELVMLLNSFYEYCDMRLYMYQMFGGENRPIYPSVFRTFLIIPDEMLNFEYVNPVDGVRYNLDWESAGAYEVLVKTTNKNEIVVPVNINPRYTLINQSDASMKYGGTDKLADWRLSLNIEYEIEMPWYVYLKTDYLIEKVDFNFTVSSFMTKSENAINPSNNLEQFASQFDLEVFDKTTLTYSWGMQDGVHSPLVPSQNASVIPPDEIIQNQIESTRNCEKSNWRKSGFYFYEITQDDINDLENGRPTTGFEIISRLDDNNQIHIFSKYGKLVLNIHYMCTNINTRDVLIQLIHNNPDEDVIWKENDILEIYCFSKI